MKRRVDLMVDMETLGFCEDAVVLSMCICVFDRETMEVIESRLLAMDVRSQLLEGRRVEPEVQDWWVKRGTEFFDQMYGYSSLSVVRDIVETIQEKYYVSKVWSRGCMDWHILQHICGNPFKYYQFADLRTLDIFGVKSGEAKHTAEGDVQVQLEYLGRVLERCGLYVRDAQSPSTESSVDTADGK